jgi:hypothetical protein
MEQTKEYKFKVNLTPSQHKLLIKAVKDIIKPIKKEGLEYKIEYIDFLINYISNMERYQYKKIKNDDRYAVSISYLNKLFEKQKRIITDKSYNKLIIEQLNNAFINYTFKINNKSTRGYKFVTDYALEQLNNLLEETEKNIK